MGQIPSNCACGAEAVALLATGEDVEVHVPLCREHLGATRIPSSEALTETCRGCGGQPLGCAQCGGTGRRVRGLYSPESAVAIEPYYPRDRGAELLRQAEEQLGEMRRRLEAGDISEKALRACLDRVTAERDVFRRQLDARADDCRAVARKALQLAREAVDGVFENERRAISKGSAPYGPEFLRAALADALSSVDPDDVLKEADRG